MRATHPPAFLRALGWENVRFALRSIRVQRLRSFLTLLGIMAGVATVIAMVSFVAGFNDAITGAFSSFGTTLVQYQKYEPRFLGGPPGSLPEDQRRRRDLTLDDALALKRSNTLAAAVSPERTFLFMLRPTSPMTFKNRNGVEVNAPRMLGVTPDYAPAKNATLQDGRFLLDASGFGRVLPRLLKLEKPSTFPSRKAIFTHVEDRMTSKTKFEFSGNHTGKHSQKHSRKLQKIRSNNVFSHNPKPNRNWNCVIKEKNFRLYT